MPRSILTCLGGSKLIKFRNALVLLLGLTFIGVAGSAHWSASLAALIVNENLPGPALHVSLGSGKAAAMPRHLSIESPVPTCTPSTGLIISEFRLRGPNGVIDEFIEFYNNTDQDITVCTADGSDGWALVTSDGLTKVRNP